jgi:hypothetical protein
MNLEGQIASIETANINKETLDALGNASKAMKTIHGGLTIDKVDATMEDLEEQHAISKEIASALTQGSTANAVDDDELESELADLQQEELDNTMLKTGTVPVHDQVHRMPNVSNTERELLAVKCLQNTDHAQRDPRHLRKKKRTTRRPSSGDYKPRWPCNPFLLLYPSSCYMSDCKDRTTTPFEAYPGSVLSF